MEFVRHSWTSLDVTGGVFGFYGVAYQRDKHLPVPNELKELALLPLFVSEREPMDLPTASKFL